LEFPQDLGIALSFQISRPIYIASPYQSILHVGSEIAPCSDMTMIDITESAIEHHKISGFRINADTPRRCFLHLD